MSHYSEASVCEKGHLFALTTDLTSPVLMIPPAKDPRKVRCPQCGTRVLIACLHCDGPIRGGYTPRRQGQETGWERPDFCMDCGRPFPWSSRRQRFYELERRLSEEDLDPATALHVGEDLQALADMDPDDWGGEEEAKLWSRIEGWAPGFVETHREIIVSVASEAARQAMWG